MLRCDNGEFLNKKYACSGLYPHCEAECKICTMGAFHCENETSSTKCLEPSRVNFIGFILKNDLKVFN